MAFNVHDITVFDWVVAAILFLFLVRGLWVGFVRQFVATIALGGSWWVASEYAGLAMPYVENFVQRPGAVFFLSFGGLLLLSTLIFALIGQLLHKVLEVNLLGWANRLAGGLLAVARGSLLIVLVYMLVAALLPASHPWFAGSLSVPYLAQGSDIVRQFIRDVTIRKDLKPRPAEKPSQQELEGLPQTVPPQTAEKVETVTIPDQGEAPEFEQESALPDQENKTPEGEDPILMPTQGEPVLLPPEQNSQEDTVEEAH